MSIVTDIVSAIKKEAQRRHAERRLADLKARRAQMVLDLEAMAHWPAQVQTNLRNQLGWLDAQIERMEERKE